MNELIPVVPDVVLAEEQEPDKNPIEYETYKVAHDPSTLEPSFEMLIEIINTKGLKGKKVVFFQRSYLGNLQSKILGDGWVESIRVGYQDVKDTNLLETEIIEEKALGYDMV